MARSHRVSLQRAGAAGVVGVATVLGLSPTAHADPAPANQTSTAPDTGTDAGANSTASHSPRGVQPQYGRQKYRVGVQLKDGSYAPSPTPPATITGGTQFTVTETGPNQPQNNTFTCTTTDSSQDTTQAGNAGTTTYCPGSVLARRSAGAGTGSRAYPRLHRHPTPGQPTNVYFAGAGDTITITQTTVEPNLQLDTKTATLRPCVDTSGIGVCTVDGTSDTPDKSTDIIFDDNGIPPDAADDSASTPYQTPVTVDALANDDAKGAPITGFSVTSAPGNGSASVVSTGSGKQIRYTPDNGFAGTDTFKYTLSTGNGSATATVTVDVGPAPAPPAPTAKDDYAKTKHDQAVDIDVTANDNPRGRDITAVKVLSDPAHGNARVVQTSTGTEIRYTPDAEYHGSDTFRYSITTDGGTAAATVHITVTPGRGALPTTVTSVPPPPSTSPPPPLANTGTDSAGFLQLGGMLLLLGGAATVAGRRRRRGRHAH